jgi:hypothetical protein
MKPADRVNQFPQLSSMGIVGGTVDQTIEQNLLPWFFSSFSWSSLVFGFPFRETSLGVCAMSDEPTENQIEDEINRFLNGKVALSGLSLEASAELLRFGLLVDECKQGELNEEA